MDSYSTKRHLKHLTNFECTENTQSSNIVECERERHHIPIIVCRSRSADIEQQGRHRQEKIARFRRRKQLEESLQELRLQATKDHADDEISVGVDEC